LTLADPIWLHEFESFLTVLLDGSAPDLPIRNSSYDAVCWPLVPRWPPHEIMRNRLCAWELAAFAASCRNGLMTLFKAQ